MSQELSIPDRGDAPDVDEGSIFFVGTATVILRFAGFTILTDPNFLHAGDHVHLGYGLTSRRRTNPAIDIEQLPPVDFVLLSHLHEDHFDRLVEQKLDKRLAIVTTPEAAASLRRKGFAAARGLSTWESLVVRRRDVSLRLTALPGKHGPGVVDHLLPDVMGALLEFEGAAGAVALRLYVSGDTLVHDELREIPKRHPGIDLALLHLGGTRVLGVLVTMDAQQGLAAMRLVGPRMTVPIHYDDYEAFRSPLEDFAAAVRAAGLQAHVTYLARGETYVFRPAELRALTPMPLAAEPVTRRRSPWIPVAAGAAAAGAAWLAVRSVRARRP